MKNAILIENRASDATLLFSYDIFESMVIFESCSIYFSLSNSTLIDIIYGNLLIRNTIILNSINPTLFASYSNVNIFNSSFNNSFCASFQSGCLLSSSNANILIWSSIFFNVQSLAILSGAFYLEESSCKFFSSKFEDLASPGRGTCFYSLKSNIIFELVNITKVFPSCVYIYRSDFYMVNTSLGKNVNLEMAPLISVFSKFIAYGSVFSENHGSEKGGAMYFLGDSKRKSELVIINLLSEVIFENNSAYSKGGAIYSENQNFIINNSIFLNNKANFGGSLFTSNSQTISIIFTIQNSLFKKNMAKIEGGAIKYESDPVITIDCVFEENIAVYGKNLANYPIRMGFQILKKNYNVDNNFELIFDSEKEKEFFIFDNIISGETFDYKIEVQLYDQLGEKINNINERLIFFFIEQL